jgi:hypothetical protein
MRSHADGKQHRSRARRRASPQTEEEDEMDKTVEAGHPALERLPHWPPRTIGILATVDPRPYAIPVSAPVRVGDQRILMALRRSRGSLARLRRRPEVALAVLAEGNVAFTACGRAHVVAEPMVTAQDYAAVAIDVERIDDHRQREFEVDAGIGRHWVDANEQHALRGRIEELHKLVNLQEEASGDAGTGRAREMAGEGAET